MNINNGQFNTHLSLDVVSFCFLNSFHSIVTHTHSNFILQCYDTLIGSNAAVQMQVQSMQHQYLQPASMPVYLQPMPSPQKNVVKSLVHNTLT
jgi:hypothetical protein